LGGQTKQEANGENLLAFKGTANIRHKGTQTVFPMVAQQKLEQNQNVRSRGREKESAQGGGRDELQRSKVEKGAKKRTNPV